MDLLLSISDSFECFLDGTAVSKDRKLRAQETIFGWAIGGTVDDGDAKKTCLIVDVKQEEATNKLLTRFWEIEDVPDDEPALAVQDQQAVDHFESTTVRLEDGRYQVRLPRKENAPPLGESRLQAQHRFEQNERALQRKGTLDAYVEQVNDYAKQGHSEKVPPEDMLKPTEQTYYLPMHGVSKLSSSTTKLRVVCDASAKTAGGPSLNDTLIPGPSLYPRLTTVLLKFRLYDVAYSADISRMFREVALYPDDKDLHRYLVRNQDGRLEDWRMSRVTFGVTSSPFLATATLQRLARDHASEHPTAALVKSCFYVDDFLHGSNSLQDALAVRKDVNALLLKGQMRLRKWRTNSKELLASIPEELRETESLQLGSGADGCPKALGVHWQTTSDIFYVATPPPLEAEHPTKRQIASQMAKVFDVLGWFAPVTVKSKHLIQQLWKRQIDWDKPIPGDLLDDWNKWNKELPSISKHPIERKLVSTQTTVLEIQLHGYSDASQMAYGAVVYARHLHDNATVTTALVTAKSKIAPVKELSVPRLELCGAQLLARLITVTAQEMDVSASSLFCWCDSTAVLGWLRSPPDKGAVFVRNRVRKTIQLLPAENWRYVRTHENPADLVSRGSFPVELLEKRLWWHGPEWLRQPPANWPIRLDIGDPPVEVYNTPTQGVVLTVQPNSEPEVLHRCNSLHRIVNSLAIGKNWRKLAKEKNQCSVRPTSDDQQAARTQIISQHQQLHFPREFQLLKRGKPVSMTSPLISLNPILDDDNIIRITGRLQNANMPLTSKQPILLAKNSRLTTLLLLDTHTLHNHPGARTMMSILSETYYVAGLRALARRVAQSCVKCRQVNANTCQQKMGQMPPQRVNLVKPFQEVGVDYAGPLLVKRGSSRRPVLEKAYVAVFTCMCTRAVHLELVSSLSTDAFLAALKRFVSRRGLPTTIYSDNGTNFVGANRDIQVAISSQANRDSIQSYTTQRQVKWKFSPVQSPHHGGLWEASVREMKRCLLKIVGQAKLDFEALTTVLAEAEASLNSRPIASLDAMPDDGCPVLTPGHFITGRPLQAVPEADVNLTNKLQGLKRWNLVQRLSTELRLRWQQDYLRLYQKSSKWKRSTPNLQVGDIVGIKGVGLGRQRLSLALVHRTFPGPDGLVRVVELFGGKHYTSRAVQRLVLLLPTGDSSATTALASLPPEDVWA